MTSPERRAPPVPRLVTAALLAAAAMRTPLGAIETGLETGKLFPDLVLPSLEGGSLRSVSSFRGKKTLLLVYASW